MIVTPPADVTLPSLRVAAESGDPPALYRLASALTARRKTEEAFTYYKRAAIDGFVPAQMDLARMLLHGTGCLPDPRTAVYWLRRAEAAGHAEASYHLAFISLGGVAMPRDGRINERVLTAVQGEYPPALRAAAIHFGRKRHEVDQSSCVRLLDRAATYGDIVAAQLLAERLAFGEGCAVQTTAAQRIRRRLADLGHASLPTIAMPAANAAPERTQESEAVLPGTIALEEVLHAASIQTLSSQPLVMQIDGLLSADECRLLIARAQHSINSPRTMRLDATCDDLATRLVQLRMARSARMELAQAEHLLVSRFEAAQVYRPGEETVPSSEEANAARAGERVRTVHVFLNAIENGGGIGFASAGLFVAAVPGRAVIVDSTEPDDVQNPNDFATPTRERKWLATLHFRHRRYRDF